MQNRKPRALRIGIDPSSAGRVRGIRINADGAIQLLDDSMAPIAVASSSPSLAYDRAKGPKTTVQIFDEPGGPSTVPAAISKFARVFGVDTNSRTHGNCPISVSTVSTIKDYVLSGAKWSCHFEALWAIEFR